MKTNKVRRVYAMQPEKGFSKFYSVSFHLLKYQTYLLYVGVYHT